MKLGRKRYQHSREISRALEDAAPDPMLFPEAPRDRLEVEEAERWGEEILQEAPRRIYRWVASNVTEFRIQMADEAGLPVPSLAGRLTVPVAKAMGRQSGSNDKRVQATLALLPALLDRVEQLIDQDVIGDLKQPNAADFQIVTSVRILLTHEDIADRIADRDAAKWAMALMPEYPGTVPAHLPEEWLAPLSVRG
jgi:glutathione S-transferase